MQPFTQWTAIAAPIDLANVDTDQIIPARFLRKLRGPGYERLAFHDIRFDADGRENPDFVLNQPPYRDAKILVAGANFGCEYLGVAIRSEEHTSELQSPDHLVCRLLL